MRRASARTYAFDALLAGLTAAFADARLAAQAQYVAQLRSVTQTGQRALGPAEAGVSVASLRAFRHLRIGELSIEFECATRNVRREPGLQLVLSRPSFWRRRRLHRVRIEIVDGAQPHGRASVDGHVFRRFPIHANASVPMSPAPPA